MSNIHNKKQLKNVRRILRKKQTLIEGLIWKHIKNNGIGYRFRRQHSIGSYVVDFYCATAKLVIELDGSYHGNEPQKMYDEQRTSYLHTLNLTVVRYTSTQVLHDVHAVLYDIAQHCNRLTTSPTPSSTEEGNL